jgi:hypothetical protein
MGYAKKRKRTLMFFTITGLRHRETKFNNLVAQTILLLAYSFTQENQTRENEFAYT